MFGQKILTCKDLFFTCKNYLPGIGGAEKRQEETYYYWFHKQFPKGFNLKRSQKSLHVRFFGLVVGEFI